MKRSHKERVDASKKLITDEMERLRVEHLKEKGYWKEQVYHNMSAMGKVIKTFGTTFRANFDEFEEKRVEQNATPTWLSSFLKTRFYDYAFLNHKIEITCHTNFKKETASVYLQKLPRV